MQVSKRSVILIITSLVLSLIYALPNFYPDVPILDIHHEPGMHQALLQSLTDTRIQTTRYRIIGDDEATGTFRLGFSNTEQQMQAKQFVEKKHGHNVQTDINLLPNTPRFFQWFGAMPMKLGLDLRGGVHLLLEVDTSGNQSLQGNEMTQALESLRKHKIRYQKAQKHASGFHIAFHSNNDQQQAQQHLRKHFPMLTTATIPATTSFSLQVHASEEGQQRHLAYLMQKTIESIQNRVNELGLSEAIVTQQGNKHISVDLPGIQDIQKAKALLGNTSSLRFHLVKNIGESHANTKELVVKNDSEVAFTLDEQPLLTGDAIVYAVAANHEGKPVIQVQLNSSASRHFYSHTQANIGKPMAIVLAKSELDAQKKRITHQRIISSPIIQDALKDSFIISGIHSTQETETLALLLRSGSLAAPVDIVSQTTVGPSLGADNIRKGVISIALGLGAIMLFMVAYYRRFGLIANFSLLLNLSIMVMLMSWLEATLTLPAMAAMVLSVGMAVDANVLINERIREEIRLGKSDEQATKLGYEKAFSSIFDANVTTLIVAGILYLFSGGVIKGFAITLIVGLLASLYTSVYVTRVTTVAFFSRLSPLSKAIGV